jgi:hypothetical protein
VGRNSSDPAETPNMNHGPPFTQERIFDLQRPVLASPEASSHAALHSRADTPILGRYQDVVSELHVTPANRMTNCWEALAGDPT